MISAYTEACKRGSRIEKRLAARAWRRSGEFLHADVFMADEIRIDACVPTRFIHHVGGFPWPRLFEFSRPLRGYLLGDRE
jgi:hypothetical protein